MGYRVGVSTGSYVMGQNNRDLLGLERKLNHLGSTMGVNFLQIDIDDTSEFLEPDFMRKNNPAFSFKRTAEKFGIEVGLHGKVTQPSPVESASLQSWRRAQKEFIETIIGARKIEADYILFHLSSGGPYVQESARSIRQVGDIEEMLSPTGRPFNDLVEISKGKVRDHIKKKIIDDVKEDYKRHSEKVRRKLNELVKEIGNKDELVEDITNSILEENARNIIMRSDTGDLSEDEIEEKIDEIKKELKKENLEMIEEKAEEAAIERLEKKYSSNEEFREEVDNKLDDFIYDIWSKEETPRGGYSKRYEQNKYFLSSAEISAYILTLEWLKAKDDILWNGILDNYDNDLKKKSPEDIYHENPEAFNAIGAAAYLEGHIKYVPKNEEDLFYKIYQTPVEEGGMGEMSILEYAEKFDIKIALETPHKAELPTRLIKPSDAYYLTKKIDRPNLVTLAIDYEHLLMNRVYPPEDIKKASDDLGKYTYVMHLGAPKTIHPSHLPIELGSEDQYVIYKWLYQLRQKNFKDGVLIFERGGGQNNIETFGSSVTSLKTIKKYLEKNTKPEDLPDDFFGKTPQNIERQKANMREHALDPLKDFLKISDEEHTFLSRDATLKKGKGEQWKKGRYK